MVDVQDAQDGQPDPVEAFREKAITALDGLFESAKAANELHYAMALMAEFRGMAGGGWNTAEDAVNAYDAYKHLIENLEEDEPARMRVILGFYLHVAEAVGLYEVPERMMLTVEGKGNNFRPFQKLVKRHKKTGKAISPGANAVMKVLMGHAYNIDLHDLSDTFNEAFDSDLRNSIAHADYTLVRDGMRLRRRYGEDVREISWAELDTIIVKGLNFFGYMRDLIKLHIETYDPPRTIQAQLNEREPITAWTIFYGPASGKFGVTTGAAPPDGYNNPPA
jgi:hypothetical protein